MTKITEKPNLIANAPFSLVGVPIDCLGTPGGTELSPMALRQAGLVEALGMHDAGDLPVRIDDHIRDPASGIIGFKSVCSTTKSIRAAVRDILKSDRRPFLVGGCCTEVIGAMAGAYDQLGQVGFVNVDGHIDLYDGVTSPGGEAADIPVATILGYGPEGIIEPQVLLLPGYLALLGHRDLQEARENGSLSPSDVNAKISFSANEVKSGGPSFVGEQTCNLLSEAPGRFWVHLDFDVLDESVFPATDYLMPGGLNWMELVQLLRPLVESPSLIGFSIACYNPEKDPKRQCARQIVTHLSDLFAQRRP